jgi:hypothetical protein
MVVMSINAYEKLVNAAEHKSDAKHDVKHKAKGEHKNETKRRVQVKKFAPDEVDGAIRELIVEHKYELMERLGKK